jgi:antitoxin VapB
VCAPPVDPTVAYDPCKRGLLKTFLFERTLKLSLELQSLETLCFDEIQEILMLNIPPETEQLARLVAVKSGQTPEDVVRDAVAQQAQSFGVLPERQARRIDLAKVEAVLRRSANRPVLDPRAPDEIIGYDEFGIPK